MKIHASLSYNHSFYGPGWIWGPNDTLSDTASLAERYHGDRRATHTQFTEPPSKCICIGIPIYNASIYCTHICLPVPIAGAWRIIIACCPLILLRVLCSDGLAVAFYSPAAQHPISSMHLPPLGGGVAGAVQKQGEVVRPFCLKLLVRSLTGLVRHRIPGPSVHSRRHGTCLWIGIRAEMIAAFCSREHVPNAGACAAPSRR